MLRLVKYPMIFSPTKAENAIIVLPLRVDGSQHKMEVIDWDFLNMIEMSTNVEKRKKTIHHLFADVCDVMNEFFPEQLVLDCRGGELRETEPYLALPVLVLSTLLC